MSGVQISPAAPQYGYRKTHDSTGFELQKAVDYLQSDEYKEKLIKPIENRIKSKEEEFNRLTKILRERFNIEEKPQTRQL